MDMVSQRDLVSMTNAVVGTAFVAVTAGGSGDNTAIVGLTIDRYQYGVPLTAVVNIASQAVLAAAATLTLKTIFVEHSSDGSTWSTFATVTDPGVVSTGPGGGGTVRAMTRAGFGLREALRYLRFNFTPDLSAANTDTANVVSMVTLGGFDRLPPPVGSAA